MQQIINFIERNIGPKLFGSLSAVGIYITLSPDFQDLLTTLKETEPNLWIGVVIAYFSTYASRKTRKLPNEVDGNPHNQDRIARLESELAVLRNKEHEEHQPRINAELEKANSRRLPTSLDPGLNYGKALLPIGIRQHNPLNIESTLADRNKWRGELPSENRYAVFESPHFGLRAAAYLLRKSYFLRHNKMTVRDIILRWAPHWDNHPDSVRGYIEFVSKEIGVGPGEKLIINTSDVQLLELIKAMCRFENAQQMPYTNTAIYQAIQAI